MPTRQEIPIGRPAILMMRNERVFWFDFRSSAWGQCPGKDLNSPAKAEEIS